MMIDQAAKLRSLTRATISVDAPDPIPWMARQESGQRASIIAVTSGKGGVGKTNIALMLSIALANLRRRVLLFDADLGLANVHILLGMSPQWSLHHVAEGRCSIDQIVCEGPSAIDIVPGASGIAAMANIDALRLEILRRQLTVFERRYDIIVVDTSAGIGSITTEFAMHADAVLCVMTPEPTSLADAYAMLKALAENSGAQLFVAVNMAVSDQEGEEAFQRMHALCGRFLKKEVTLAGILPADRQVQQLIRRQRVMLLENPKSQFSVRIVAMARRLFGIPQAKRDGFFARVFRREE